METVRPDVQRVITILQSVSPATEDRSGEFHAGSTLESDFGLGSLERVELRVRLESAFGVEMSDEAFLQARTVSDLVALLGRSTPGEPQPRVVLSTATPAARRPDGLQEATTARSLDEILVVQAAAQPNATAITFLKEGKVAQALTYTELLQACLRMAGGLVRHGVAPGDRVGLMLPTGLPFVAGFFGTLMCGAIPVPMYPPVRPDQIHSFVQRQSGIISNAGVKLLLSFPQVRSVDRWLRAGAGSLQDVVSAEELLTCDPLAHPVEPQSDAIGFIQYTSGSTGVPRGVVLTHENLFANLRSFGHILELVPEDVVVSWLPLYHDMGLIGMLLGGLYYGLPIVLMGPEDFLMRPSRWLRALHEYGGSVSAAPNFAFEICARKVQDSEIPGLDLSRWRAAINGAEPVRTETLERFLERFEVFGFRPSSMRPAYGLAEATLAVSMSLPGRAPRVDVVSRESLDQDNWAAPVSPGDGALPASFVSCGRPVLGVEVRIVDAHGQVVKERWQGRLHFRGESAFRRYYENPQATADMVLADGWVDSGDLAYVADGEIYPTGRRKALILKGGRNIHAEDVERAVWPTTGVRSGCVAAFGALDPNEGTERLVVVAESRLRQPREQTRMVEEIRQRVLESVGVPPDEVRVVPPGRVPKTPSGKIRRSACRAAYLDGTLGRRLGVVGQLAQLASETPGYWLGLLRRGLYSIWFTLCVVMYAVGMCLATLLGVVGPVSAPASRLLLRLLGFNLTVQGPLPQRGPLLLVPNHASMMDSVVLMAACPRHVRFVAAAWSADLPVVSYVLKGLRGVRIKRGTTAQSEVEQMVVALAERWPVVAFAEGGLEMAPGLHPFMRGPFVAAARNRTPIIPVAVAGTRRGLRWGQYVPTPGPLSVTFNPSVTPDSEEWDEVTRCMQAVREAVAQQCGEGLVPRRLIREDH